MPPSESRQVWLMELCLVEYLEQLFFRDSASSLLWWPKVF
jgi:hypothetical protein